MGTSIANELVIATSNLTVPAGGFVDSSTGILNGTLVLSGTVTASNPVFNTATPVIPATGGFWLNNPNFTVSAQGGDWTLSGLLRVSAGTFNVGTGNGNSIVYSSGPAIVVEGGAVNIAGRLSRNALTSTISYTQSGGVLTVVTQGSTSTIRAGFDIGAAGSSFTMSGGTIVVQRPTSNTTGDYLNLAGTHNVTGGTLQIGNASTPAGQTIGINSSAPVFNLTVNSTNALIARVVTNNLTVKGNVSILGNARLDANSLNLNVAGNWTSGNFTPGTGTVTFNGATTQTLTAALPITFANLSVFTNTLLVESAVTDTAAYTGTLSNFGTIRKAKAISGTGLKTFGLTGTSITVTTAGTLSNLQVDRIDRNHPSAPASLQTGRYWIFTPTGTGYTVDLTLPHTLGASHTTAEDCRYTGSGTTWECARSASTTTTVTRSGVTQLASDWAVGNNPPADVSITKSDSPDPVNAAATLTYTLNVANNGPKIASSVRVTDTLPGGITFNGVACPGWTSCGQSGGVVTATLGTLPVGSAPPITITVTAPTSGGTITNTAVVTTTTTDSTPANNTASITTAVTPVANLSIAKSDAPDPVTAGTLLTYTLAITNNGPSTATGVQVTDTLPISAAFQSISAPGGWSCATPPVGSTGTITCTTASLAVGSAAFAVETKVAASTPDGATLVNTSGITSAVLDQNLSDNTATALTTINTSADLSIVKSDSPDPVVAGTTLVYTLTVTNTGPSDAQAVTVTDTLPSGVTLVSAPGCVGTTSLTCALGTLASGGSANVVITVTVNANTTGALTNSAGISSTTNDPNGTNNTAAETTTVNTLADLSVVKTDSPDPVLAGTTLVYTLTATNTGPSDAQGVTITDTLPAGVTFVSANPAQSGGPNPLVWNVGALASGASTSLVVTVTVNANTADGSTLTNTADVVAPTSDPNSANNTATETTSVITSADLSIVKSDSPDPVTAGTTLVYTLTVANAGPSDAQGVTVTDALPSDATLVSAPGCSGATTLTCVLGALASGGNATIVITVTVNANVADGVTLTNTADVGAVTSDPDSANNTATEATTVNTLADLSLTKTDTPDPVNAAATLTYTLSVNNAGPSDAASVVVTDTLPGGVAFVSASGSGWACNQSAGVVTCTRASLAAGAAPDITVLVTTPNNGGTLTNDATVDAATADPNAGNNSDSLATTVISLADLSIVKSDDPDPVNAGATLTYTLGVSNSGPSDATSVVVTDTLPGGVTFVSANGIGWACTQSAGIVTCTRATLLVGTAPDLTLVVTASPVGGVVINNAASISSAVTDPDGANNSATASTTVNEIADLSITKTDGPDPVTAAAPLVYTLSVSNAGTSAATSVIVTDTLPGGVIYAGASGSGWTCGQSAGVVTCTRPNLSVGVAPDILVTVTAPSNGGTIFNTATVGSATIDPNVGNNSDMASTAVEASADLSITKTGSPDPVDAVGTLTYTLSVSNAGPSDAASVVVTDTLPGGVTFVGVSGSGWACNQGGGVVTCTIASLPVGAAPDITVVVTAPDNGGPIFNMASVGASTGDPLTGNNTDTLSTGVTAVSDLSISKSDAPDPVVAGTPLTYTLTVSNAGPSDAASVIVTDTLPTGVTLVSVSSSQGGCSSLPCNLGAVASGGNATVTVVVTVASSATGSLANAAGVSSAASDPDASNNVASATTAVSTSADLSIAKSDSPDPVNAAATLTYTLSVNNAGPSDAASVTVTDTLPGGVAFVSASGSGWACNQSLGVVTCTRAFLAVGAAPDITLVATTPSSGGTIANNASVSSATGDPNSGNNADSATTNVTPVADLSITKTGTPDPVNAAATLTYTLSVNNAGPSTATVVTVTDTLPGSVTFVSASGSGWTCNQSAGAVTCTRASLAVGAAPDITVVVTAPKTGGTIANNATVSSATNDLNSANNSTSANTGVIATADLSISKTDSQTTAVPGTTITYILAVSNSGPSDVTGALVVDNFPVAVTSASWSCAASGGSSCGAANGSGNVSVNVDLPSGSVVTFIVTADLSASATGSVSNTATVAAPGGVTDPNGSNNTSTDTDALTPLADLTLAKSDAPDPVNAAATLTYTLSAANAGPSDAASVTVTDALPGGVTFVSATGAGWSCGQSTGVVTCTRATLALGAAPDITVVVTAPVGGSLINTASVASVTSDPDTSNNTASASTAVTPLADLSIAKSDTPDPVNAGAALTYTLSIANAGPGTATAITVTDNLPAGVTFVSVNSADWSCVQSADIVTCTRATLAPGAAPDIVLAVTAPSDGGLIANTAVVAAATSDPSMSDNTSTASTTVMPVADLSIAKTGTPDPVNVGATLTYTLNVNNAGPSSATSVIVTDTLPGGVTFVSASGAGWGCGQSAGVITCTRASLATGAAPGITIAVTAPANGGALTNTAVVVSATFDPNTGDNTATASTTVTPLANLAISKTDGQITVTTGLPLTYTIVVTNFGPNAATGASVTDALPAGLTGVTWTCLATGGSSCTANGSGNISTTVNLVVGGVATFTVPGVASTVGVITNTAAVSAPGGMLDPDLSNNAATDTTTALPPIPVTGGYRLFLPLVVKDYSASPDLVGSFSLSTPNPAAGQPVTITVVITNQGNSPANNFWVDFYINPSTPPTSAVVWDKVCGMAPCYGIAWYISTPLEPGQSLTLDSTPASYYADNTIWFGAFAPGTQDLYLYVDSYSDDNSPNGAIGEANETNNRAELHGLATSGLNLDQLQPDGIITPPYLAPRSK